MRNMTAYIELSDKEIVRLYLSGQSLREVAVIFSVSAFTIKKRLLGLGIALRAKSHPIGKYAGEKSWHWKGGTTRMSDGRVQVYKPDHHKADHRGYVYRYVLVWEEFHKKSLPDGYIIHHINEKNNDDRPENLQSVTRAEHQRIHKPRLGTGKKKEKD
jgi:hypothetical protein